MAVQKQANPKDNLAAVKHMYRYKNIMLCLCLLILLAHPISTAIASAQTIQSKITIINTTKKEQLKNRVLLDARDLKICQASSVSGAKCLAANTFHSNQGDLASFYDIGWAFGTANLKETDDVLIFADKAQDRNALAGLLFLAGHQKVSVWTGKISELQKLLGSAAGQGRGILRSEIYSGIMRDHYIALPDEIEALDKNGWQIVIVPNLKPDLELKDKKLLIAGKSPIKNIATFAQLQAEGQHHLLLSIDNKP